VADLTNRSSRSHGVLEAAVASQSMGHGCCVIPHLDHSNCGVSEESVLGPILFNTFINNLEDVVEGTFMRFADDRDLGALGDRQEGRLEGQAGMDAVVHRSEQSCAVLYKHRM